MLSEFLVSNGIRTEHAEADADVMIANTGIALAENYPTIIIGEDTDILVLLLFHSSTNTTLHYKSDQSNRRANTLKVWDISKTKKLLGDQLCHVLPVIHAITGCDTTSRLFGIGKGLVLKKVMGNQDLIEIAGKVFDVDSSDVVAKFGIQLKYVECMAASSLKLLISCVTGSLQVRLYRILSISCKFKPYHQLQLQQNSTVSELSTKSLNEQNVMRTYN